MRRAAWTAALSIGAWMWGMGVAGGGADLLQRADSLLAAGDTAGAYRLYQQLGRQKVPLAYRGLGLIALRWERWKEAKENFQKLLKSGADDLTAHYGLAIAYRELGARSGGVVRASHWGLAEKHFAAVLQADSSFRDVLYQLALLRRHQRRYFEAVQLGLRGWLRGSDLREAAFGLFELYDYLLAHEPPDTVEGWLLRDPTPCGRYFLGELYRRYGHLSLADSIFRSLLQREWPFPKQPILLSLARLHYAAGDPLLADEYYWQAVRTIDSDLGARFVFEDVKYILDDTEWLEYQLAAGPSQKIRFFRRLWEKRNPRPGSPDNPRIREHYRRLVLAEQAYRYDDLRLPVNNPDRTGFLRFPQTFWLNRKLNDKGLVFVRYGEPDLRATALDSELVPNESWMYHVPGLNHPLVFHFEIDEDGGPNNWRLVPVPTDDRILSSREEWDPMFTRYLRGSPMTRDELRNQMAFAARNDILVGLSHDRHTWPSGVTEFRCPLRVASFRGAEGRTDLVLFYAIDGAVRFDSLWEMGAAVYDPRWELLGSSRQLHRLSPGQAPEAIEGVQQFSLPPGPYRIGFYAEGLTTRQIAGVKLAVSLTDFARNQLLLSDLVLGSVEPQAKGTWRRGGAAIRPNPTHRFRTGEPVGVYFEIYNMKIDNEGKARYTVELCVEPETRGAGGKFGGILRFLSGRAPARVITRAERTAAARDVFECLSVEIPSEQKGRYRLSVAVQDLVAGSRDRTSSVFELR
ncbi:MAG: GWxTD domain-containing protein [candidate division KSB1 bacterium]|nr:GWxTD domain-containing protein [candidate division KSB1 bacterium]